MFSTKHFPDCFINSDLIDNMGKLITSYGNEENVIKLCYDIDSLGKIREYRGYEDNVYGYKKGTEPIQVKISKPNGANRLISISNPLALVPLDFYIKKNVVEILSEQEDQNEKYYSSSSYSYDANGIIVGYTYDGDILMEETEELVQNGFDNKELITHNICSGKYYHMSIDISNFFNSIYSHSLSWDLKNVNNKLIFDNIDVLSRNLNKNETKGILIGPYSSGIISEIILSKIDRLIIEKYKNDDISFVHFCDDYDFFSDSKEKLENDVKNYVGELFSKYGLDLNFSKYKIEEFPFISLNIIQNERIFILKNRIKGENFENALEYIENIMNELSTSLKKKYYNCNYLLVILNSMYEKNEIPQKYLDKETSKILLDYLVNMIFKNDLVSKPAVSLILNIFKNINLSYNEEIFIVEKWIKKRNSCSTQLKEIIDIWLQYLLLRINCKSNIITEYMIKCLNFGVLQSVLTIEYLHYNNLILDFLTEINSLLNDIKGELNKRFGNNWKQAAYDTKYWILFYTNCKRWQFHKLKEFNISLFKELFIPNLIKIPSMPKRLEILQFLLENDVDFFNIDV